jgi:hypothetical protein
MSEPVAVSLTTAAAAAAAPIVKETLGALAKTMSTNIGKVAKGATDRAIVALQLGFNDYLVTSYNRCRTFKSILSPQEPIDLLQHYVNVNLSCNKKTIPDFDLSDQINIKRHVVVTGLAGSGKSMFMKYITVSHFENPQGKVPLFVELRQINSVTDFDLLTFLRSSCTSKDHVVSPEQFALSLRSGAMLLILDGFDELHHEIRDNVQKQILLLSKDYPNTTVVISSRPDERFHSWSDYFVYKVDELSQSQVEQLIRSLKYSPGVKRRFLKEVSSRLYKSHKSFLSSPLLASIMLLTYEEFAEIPQKMHSFYGQAFDTLFQKHDAQKEQYQRKTHTQLPRDSFKDCFSAFCALSYLEQQFSFSDDQLSTTANNAVKYMRQTSEGFPASVTGRQFADDLFESVCMMQKDGLESAFVHRSFQEYFAALFVGGLPGPKIKLFLDKYTDRFSDSVIPMTLDLYRSTVEAEWVMPAIVEVRSILDLQKPRENLTGKLHGIFPRLILHHHRGELMPTAFGFSGSQFGRIEALSRAYPKHLPRNLILKCISETSIAGFRKQALGPEHRKEPAFEAVERFLTKEGASLHFFPEDTPVRKVNPSQVASLVLPTDNHDWWLDAIGLGEAFEKIAKGLSLIEREITGRDRRRDNILQDFFA